MFRTVKACGINVAKWILLTPFQEEHQEKGTSSLSFRSVGASSLAPVTEASQICTERHAQAGSSERRGFAWTVWEIGEHVHGAASSPAYTVCDKDGSSFRSKWETHNTFPSVMYRAVSKLFKGVIGVTKQLIGHQVFRQRQRGIYVNECHDF